MEILKYTIYFICELYMVYLLLKAYKILNANNNKSKMNVIVLISAIALLINNLLILKEFRVLFSFLIIYFTYKLYFKENSEKCFANTIITFFTFSIVELLLSVFLYLNISNIILFNNNILLKLGYSVITFNLGVLILKNKYINKRIRKIQKLLEDTISLKIFILFILFIFNMLFIMRISKLNNIYNILCITISLIYIVINLVLIIKEKYIIENLKIKNNNLMTSYKSYSKIVDEFKVFKHNLKNELLSIMNTVPKEKREQFQNLIKKYNKNYEWLDGLENIPDGLQAIIYIKQLECKKENIDIVINYNLKNFINDKDYIDLCDVISICLDNAIEAVKTIDTKIIFVDIYCEAEKIIIKIYNEFNNVISLNEIGNKNYSTKKKKSGIGIHYINELKNKKLKYKMEIKNNLFISKIEYSISKN